MFVSSRNLKLANSTGILIKELHYIYWKTKICGSQAILILLCVQMKKDLVSEIY